MAPGIHVYQEEDFVKLDIKPIPKGERLYHFHQNIVDKTEEFQPIVNGEIVVMSNIIF